MGSHGPPGYDSGGWCPRRGGRGAADHQTQRAAATDGRFPAPIAPLVIGFALAAAVFIGGPTDGAAVNPARGLGPMIAAGSFSGWWVSLIGSLFGGVIAAVLYDRFVRRGRTPEVEHR
ncbi:aquaporin [Streptomyces colonosanans]|uniref:aquaporin n=1 Tax=Streptomyces colonosanans TaxID=1428652 RepID=UPI001FE61A2C|nr:aquaporin [Streptomyces colonosanans]